MHRGGSKDHKNVPIHLVVKMQALARGFIARRKVQRVYGFQMSEGLLYRQFDLDPEKLEEQRYRVQQIRSELPPFQYGINQ